MSKSFIIHLLAMVFLAVSTQAAQHRVETVQDIERLAAQLKPGDELLVADGRYEDWTMTLSLKGTDERPIVIRPATPAKAVFTGKTRLILKGSEHVIIRDFMFDGCHVSAKSIVLLDASSHCRITACRFVDSIGKKNDQVVRVSHRSADNRIDHCTFINIGARCVQVVVEEDYQTEGHPVGTRIDHNLFQDVPTVKKGDNAPNGRETIQVGRGVGSECELKTIVEHNTFLRCNGENECISNKTSANIYRFNSFKDQVGCLSLRGASKCIVEGNRLDNTPGIHVQGFDHVIINNVILRSGGNRKPGKQSTAGSIVLGYGMKRNPDSQFPQHYKPAEGCLVANNTIVDPPMWGLIVGSGKNQDWRDKGLRNVPPSRNRIVNNVIVGQAGELLWADEAPDNAVDHNLVHAAGSARVSTPGASLLKADPRFRDAASGDYRLAPGSPGLKAGLPLPEVKNSVNLGAAADPRGAVLAPQAELDRLPGRQQGDFDLTLPVTEMLEVIPSQPHRDKLDVKIENTAEGTIRVHGNFSKIPWKMKWYHKPEGAKSDGVDNRDVEPVLMLRKAKG